MATGASTADLAIILIDARNGVLPQSRRHAFIANLLGIRHFVVAINKMDLVGFDEAVYDAIRIEFTGFMQQIGAPARALHSHQRARRRQRGRKERPHPLVPRPGAARISRRSPRRQRTRGIARAFSRAVCAAPQSGFPRLRRPAGLRRVPQGRSGAGAARAPSFAHHAHRHLRRRSSRSQRSAIGHPLSRRRNRYQPRRHDRPGARSPRTWPAASAPASSG